jgi:ATP synthase protein I
MAAKPPDLRGGWNAIAVGSDMVAGIFAGAALGYFLDQWLDTQPWLLLIGLGLGIAAGFVMVYRRIQNDLGGNPPKERK